MNTKRLSLFAALLCLGTLSFAETGFQVGLDLDFLNYENYFVTPSFSVMPVIAKDMELDLGLGFGIYTLNGHPHFQIPIKVGFNFIFPATEGIDLYMSIGLLPQFVWGETAEVQPRLFLAGPYVGGGVRFKLHPLMSWYVDVQQTLLIGAPNWLNTGTRLGTGMQFTFDSAKPAE